MVPPSEDDRDAIDRAFAELVAGYHLTADGPEPITTDTEEPTVASADPDLRDNTANWAADHPLFGFVGTSADVPAPEDEPTEERYVPAPLPPPQRPGIPALLGWIGIGYAILIVLAATFGVTLPSLGRLGRGRDFVGGFGILMTRLPRERPPGAGDGAVL